MHTPTKEEIISISGIHPLRVKNIYLFGSRLHGTNSEGSDFDYFVIAATLNEHVEIKKALDDGTLVNIHVVTPEKFKEDVRIYKMNRLECLFAPSEFKLLEKEPIKFDLNPKKFIPNVKFQSSESWAIAKSRIQDEDDVYRAKKSLFHSLRILDYGVQIVETGRINNFQSMNDVYDKIFSMELNSWEDIKNEFFVYKIELEKKLENSHYLCV